MTRDLSKRLDRLETRAAPARRTHFLALEGPPGLPGDDAAAFLRARGHGWGPDDIVFITAYETREAGALLRDLTGRRPEGAR